MLRATANSSLQQSPTLGRSDAVLDGLCRQRGVGVDTQLFGEFLLMKVHRLPGDAKNVGGCLRGGALMYAALEIE